MQLQNLTLPSRPGNLMLRTALSIVRKAGLPLVTCNEFGKFDTILVGGQVLPAADSLAEALAPLPLPYIVHFPATGEFDVRHTKVNIQCGLCEGSGERSKWDVCPECDGRCEKLYQDGYDGGGWPIWVSQTCHSCNGAGGAENVYQCGFCSGDGYVECAESALMASDTIIQKELVAA